MQFFSKTTLLIFSVFFFVGIAHSQDVELLSSKNVSTVFLKSTHKLNEKKSLVLVNNLVVSTDFTQKHSAKSLTRLGYTGKKGFGVSYFNTIGSGIFFNAVGPHYCKKEKGLFFYGSIFVGRSKSDVVGSLILIRKVFTLKGKTDLYAALNSRTTYNFKQTISSEIIRFGVKRDNWILGPMCILTQKGKEINQNNRFGLFVKHIF